MRKVHVTFECDEKVLGPLIVDLSEKPNTRIVHIKAVSELPHHVNGKATKSNGHATGLTCFEVMQKIAKEAPKGFTSTELGEAFEANGLSKKSIGSFLFAMKEKGTIEMVGKEGTRGIYKMVKQ